MLLKTIFSALATLTLLTLSLNASADSGVPLHGFVDIKGGTSSSNTPDKFKMQGFSVGTLDLYLTPDFGNKVKSLIEIAFEPNSDDGSNVIDLERLQLGYAIQDTSVLWVGRFHTPYGFWNTAFHHGAQLMPTMNRPMFIDFEDLGGILPSHSVGAWLHGSSDLTQDQIVYDLYGGNGDRITLNGTSGILDYNAIKTDKNGSIIGGKIAYVVKHGSADGLQAGIHAYMDKVNSYASASYGANGPSSQANVQMTGFYASYEGDKFDINGEYYNLATSNAASGGSGNYNHSLYFVQTDMTFGLWKPFLMFEKSALDSGDTVYIGKLNNASSYTRTSAGVRYDLSAVATVKLAWAGTNDSWDNFGTGTNSDRSYTDKYSFQYAVRF